MCSFADIRPVLAVAGLLVATMSLAAPEMLDGKSMVAPPRNDLPAAVNQRTGGDQPTLRCWQYGRLVLEKQGVRLVDVPPNAHVFKRLDRDDQTIQVFDMNNGLCVLSHETAAVEPARP